MSIKVTATTMGRSNPSHVGLGGGYRWRKNPDWEPGHPKYRDGPSQSAPAAESNMARREKRITAFAAFYAELTPRIGRDAAVIEAGKRVGVGERTAQAYVRELLKRETQP